MNDILRNILLGFSIAAPLGPATMTIIQEGLRRGFLGGFLTGIGVTLADTTYLLAVYFGLSRLLGFLTVKIAIWIFGAFVLAYLGIQSLREAFRRLGSNRKFDPGEKPHLLEARSPLLVGYLVNISNPLAVVWWVGIFGSLLSAAAAENRLVALFSSFAILIGILSWHTILSLLTHWGKRVLNERVARIVSGIAGVTLMLFGLRFAWLALTNLIKS